MTDKQLSDTAVGLLAPGEVAKLLHVDPRTVTRMGDRGELAYVQLPSGHRRYRQSDIDVLLDFANRSRQAS